MNRQSNLHEEYESQLPEQDYEAQDIIRSSPPVEGPPYSDSLEMQHEPPLSVVRETQYVDLEDETQPTDVFDERKPTEDSKPEVPPNRVLDASRKPFLTFQAQPLEDLSVGFTFGQAMQKPAKPSESTNRQLGSPEITESETLSKGVQGQRTVHDENAKTLTASRGSHSQTQKPSSAAPKVPFTFKDDVPSTAQTPRGNSNRSMNRAHTRARSPSARHCHGFPSNTSHQQLVQSPFPQNRPMRSLNQSMSNSRTQDQSPRSFNLTNMNRGGCIESSLTQTPVYHDAASVHTNNGGNLSITDVWMTGGYMADKLQKEFNEALLTIEDMQRKNSKLQTENEGLKAQRLKYDTHSAEVICDQDTLRGNLEILLKKHEKMSNRTKELVAIHASDVAAHEKVNQEAAAFRRKVGETLREARIELEQVTRMNKQLQRELDKNVMELQREKHEISRIQKQLDDRDTIHIALDSLSERQQTSLVAQLDKHVNTIMNLLLAEDQDQKRQVQYSVYSLSTDIHSIDRCVDVVETLKMNEKCTRLSVQDLKVILDDLNTSVGSRLQEQSDSIENLWQAGVAVLNQLKRNTQKEKSAQISRDQGNEIISMLREVNENSLGMIQNQDENIRAQDEQIRIQNESIGELKYKIADMEKEIPQLHSQLTSKAAELEELRRQQSDELAQSLLQLQALELQVSKHGPEKERAIERAEMELQAAWEKKYNRMEKQLGGKVKTAEACKLTAEETVERCQEELGIAYTAINLHKTNEDLELQRCKSSLEAAQSRITQLNTQIQHAGDKILMLPNHNISTSKDLEISGGHSLRQVSADEQEVPLELYKPSSTTAISSKRRIVQRRSSYRAPEVTLSPLDKPRDTEQAMPSDRKRVRIGGKTSRSPIPFESAPKEDRTVQSKEKDTTKTMPTRSALKAPATKPSTLSYQDDMRAAQKAKDTFLNTATNIPPESRTSRPRSTTGLQASTFEQYPYNKIKSGTPQTQVIKQSDSQASYVPQSSAEEQTVAPLKVPGKRKRLNSTIHHRTTGQHWREPTPPL